jgi:hypothetical protein
MEYPKFRPDDNPNAGQGEPWASVLDSKKDPMLIALSKYRPEASLYSDPDQVVAQPDVSSPDAGEVSQDADVPEHGGGLKTLRDAVQQAIDGFRGE